MIKTVSQTTHIAASSQSNIDLTRPVENVPVKKWADELREIAREVSDNEIEGKSAYYFFLERAKIAAKKGKFRLHFWASSLPWTIQELEVAANLLRNDNFVVTIEKATDLQNIDIEIIVCWESYRI